MDADWQAFAEAIVRNDDDATEAAVQRLTPQHQPLLLQLAEEGGDARWWAIRALANVGDAAALPVIGDALRAADTMTRAAAALALGTVAGRNPAASASSLSLLAEHFTDADGFVRQQAVEGMALAGVAGLPLLETLIAPSQHEVVRVRAASCLRNMHDKRCAKLLFRLLNDSNHLVHTYAYEALDDLGLLDNVLLAR